MPRLLSVFILVAFLLSSCFVSRQELMEMIPPIDFAIWVRYVPETDSEAQFRMSVRPVPMDNGWTDLRMSRDLKRISDCGIQVIMVEFTPQQLANEEFVGRFRHFCDLSEKFGCQVVLSLVQDRKSPQSIQRQNLLHYLDTLDLSAQRAYLREDDRPAFLVGADFELEDADPELPENVTVMRFGVEVPPCPMSPLDDRMIPLPARFQWLRAAQCLEENRWVIQRQRGKNLSRQFKMLRQAECQVALLSSWNDYADGSFIENNSLDGEMMTNAVKKH